MSNLDQHLMNSGESTRLADGYVTTNYAEINKNRPDAKPDSKMYTIELDVLEDYLKLIRAEMENRGVKNKGVRITLGKYPEKSDDPKLKPEYQGYQMVFLSPVDMNQNKTENKDSSAAVSNKGNLEEIPNLNYMGICPPY